MRKALILLLLGGHSDSHLQLQKGSAVPTQGDINRPRSLDAEFDDTEHATPSGGSAIIERVIRRIGLRKFLNKHLPKRNGKYSMATIVEQIMVGLLHKGRGFQATEPLRQDPQVAEVFGYEDVADDATVCRATCELADLPKRTLDDAYVPVKHQQPRIDMQGNEKKKRGYRRAVPEQPEAMPEQRQKELETMLLENARLIAQRLPARTFRVAGGMVPITIDGSSLEVRGRCFDAARRNRNGDQSLELMALRVGPVYLSARVVEGASDEGRAMPEFISSTHSTVRDMVGRKPLLYMIDSAGAEKNIIDAVDAVPNAHYLIGANQNRVKLTQMAMAMPEHVWTSIGPDELRGISEAQVCVMVHKPQDWTHAQNVIVKRWRTSDEYPGAPWRYAFIYTDLERKDLPLDRLKKYGFEAYCWMLYDTKQGHENHFKTLLSDFGVHHPVSGRLGATQAFSIISAIASNLYVCVQGILPKPDRRIRLDRFLQYYVRLSAKLVRSANRLLVRLAGGSVDPTRKERWQAAFASAGKL